MDVTVGPLSKLSTKELMYLNCGFGEDSWESLRLQDQTINPKGNKFECSLEGLMLKLKTPVLWPPDAKNWVTGKDLDAGKDRRQEKGTTEDEMVGWHRQLDGHGFEQAPGVDAGQGSLECCSPWGCKELDMTEWLNWTELNTEWLNCFSKIFTGIYLIY